MHQVSLHDTIALAISSQTTKKWANRQNLIQEGERYRMTPGEGDPLPTGEFFTAGMVEQGPVHGDTPPPPPPPVDTIPGTAQLGGPPTMGTIELCVRPPADEEQESPRTQFSSTGQWSSPHRG